MQIIGNGIGKQPGKPCSLRRCVRAARRVQHHVHHDQPDALGIILVIVGFTGRSGDAPVGFKGRNVIADAVGHRYRRPIVGAPIPCGRIMVSNRRQHVFRPPGINRPAHIGAHIPGADHIRDAADFCSIGHDPGNGHRVCVNIGKMEQGQRPVIASWDVLGVQRQVIRFGVAQVVHFFGQPLGHSDGEMEGTAVEIAADGICVHGCLKGNGFVCQQTASDPNKLIPRRII